MADANIATLMPLLRTKLVTNPSPDPPAAPHIGTGPTLPTAGRGNPASQPAAGVAAERQLTPAECTALERDNHALEQRIHELRQRSLVRKHISNEWCYERSLCLAVCMCGHVCVCTAGSPRNVFTHAHTRKRTHTHTHTCRAFAQYRTDSSTPHASAHAQDDRQAWMKASPDSPPAGPLGQGPGISWGDSWGQGLFSSLPAADTAGGTANDMPPLHTLHPGAGAGQLRGSDSLRFRSQDSMLLLEHDAATM